MKDYPGITIAYRKDGSLYYRSGITIAGKHISLGSQDDPQAASRLYTEADRIYHSAWTVEEYGKHKLLLSFAKYVSLINFRDHQMYFKTPIYLCQKYFLYYLGPDHALKFDVDDLFYYSTHTIMQRGNHLFVADYGMQVSILSRYGIRDHAVMGRDYIFSNNDPSDFRYGNVEIINPYYGVTKFIHKGRDCYKARIHIHGDYIIGIYKSPEAAAIAYNKAVKILQEKGCPKTFPENYPENLSAIAYASLYNSVKISKKILNLTF